MGNKKPQKLPESDISMLSKAIMGGGCFWCTEAVFQRLKGVQKVESGYAGGPSKNPNYHQVCSGKSGHAEVIRIFYNPESISYRTLLYIFLNTHDPTTLNKQGYDSGTQYRSTIMYNTEQERKTADEVIADLVKEGMYPGAPAQIVTEVVKLDEFFPAEGDHQNFFNENTSNGYCKSIIKPKLSKFAKLFEENIDKSKL